MRHPGGHAQGVRIWAEAVNSWGWNPGLQTPKLRTGFSPHRPASGGLGFLSQRLSLASSHPGLQAQNGVSLSSMALTLGGC